MELEELKGRWSSLEEQLKKQELLTEKLIQEIRQSKSGPLKILINYAYFGIGVCTSGLFFLIVFYFYTYFAALKTSAFILGGLMLIFAIILGIYNVRHLKKIDFTKNVSDNIKLVETYKINYKKQLIVSFSLVAVFIILVLVAFISNDVESWRWWVMGLGIVVGGVLGYLEYKKIYKAQTNAIMKSLEKLKELEP